MSEALVQTIKQIAVGAVAAEKMSNLLVGTVVTVNPLSIEVENVGLLTNDFLRVLVPISTSGSFNDAFNVTVISTGQANVSGSAEGLVDIVVRDEDNVQIGTAKGTISLPVSASGTAVVSGNAAGGGDKTVTSYQNWLTVGDKVALLRYSGGNSFLVLDKVTGGDKIVSGGGSGGWEPPPEPTGGGVQTVNGIAPTNGNVNVSIKISQAAYDLIAVPDPNVTYYIY